MIWTLDIKDPTKPEVVSQCGLPWMKADDSDGDEAAGHPPDDLCTLHGPPMIRGNRMYCAWWGGGISVIDCSDLANMKLVGHLSWAPPFPAPTTPAGRSATGLISSAPTRRAPSRNTGTRSSCG